MTKRMLIDATHAEETRVVVLDGSRLEDFDVETSTKKQLKGNIYLAKVVRVEPSLQAAFVEYGGNRHGFLAFGEIHPDYYQIPVADRQRLLDMQAEDARREQEEDDRIALASSRREASDDAEADPADQSEADAADRIGPIDDAGATDDAAADDSAAGAAVEHHADAAEPPPEPSSSETVESAAAWSAPARPTAAQPLRIDIESVGGAADAPPDDDADAFRVPAAAAPGEPQTDAEQLEVVATFVAPAAETLPDGSAEVQIEAGQVAPDRLTPAPLMHDGLAAHAEPMDFHADRSAASDAQPQHADPFPAEAADAESEHAHAAYTDDTDSDTIAEDAPPPETVGGDADGAEDARERRIPPRFLRNYKIQEVIRRRQILLIQVVKEERGTKGAALTTYISLAGRYCVLMPNSPRGGGISRKITSATDRRRLKEVTAELDIPDGMGLIVRTAGANRPKPEIKRDCEYLMRLWDEIRTHTMKSVAPALIYEEASLIKRAIRDVYSRDIDEILVDGEAGWKAARDFMRMLMPTHVKKVQFWRDTQPLFARQQVEDQLDAMLSPTVQLRSGGYLVINQTEALVAIDVNSGRSTRERGIEETALRTNCEAVDEVARQLRLRDLAGLIVIDLIDMESRKNNATVERRLKEALKADRARIQVGHISHFGLMEMSRQRLRPSLAETSFVSCPHCGGTGHVRGTESAAIHVLRDIEEEGAKRRAAEILVRVASPIAMYILNHKRARLGEIEARYAMHVAFAGDDSLIPPQVRIDRTRAQTATEAPVTPDVRPDPEPAMESAAGIEDAFEDADDEGIEPDGDEAEGSESAMARTDSAGADSAGSDSAEAGTETPEEAERGRRRRRRRRRNGRRDDVAPASGEAAPATAAGTTPGTTVHVEAGNELENLLESDLEEHIEGVPEHGDAPGDTSGENHESTTPDARPSQVRGEDRGEDGGEEGRGRRRGRRGGRRRRRDGTDGGLESVAEPGAEQPELPPIYNGPTPANPFGGQAFDIFDVLEQAERAADRPIPVAAHPTPERPWESAPQPHAALGAAPHATPGAAPASGHLPAAASVDPAEPKPASSPEPAPMSDLLAEPLLEPVAAAPLEPAVEPAIAEAEMTPATLPEATTLEPVTAAPTPPLPANDVTPEPLVKPILVGDEAAPAAEKKRGWWRH